MAHVHAMLPTVLLEAAQLTAQHAQLVPMAMP